jgi:hypothetical protein
MAKLNTMDGVKRLGYGGVGEVCDIKEGRKWFAICRTGNEALAFVGRKLIIGRC